LCKYPIVTYSIFLSTGCFKGYKKLENIFLLDIVDLTVLFGAIIVLIIFFKIIRSKLRIPRISSKLIIPFLVLVILMLISLLFTEAPIYGTYKFFRFSIITTLATFAPLFLFKNKGEYNIFFYMIIIISSLMIIESISFSSSTEYEWHGAFGSDYIALGQHCSYAFIVIAFYFLAIYKNSKAKFGWIVLSILNLFGVFYSGGRMPVIALICTILLFFGMNFLTFKKSLYKGKKFIILIIVILLFLSVFIIFQENFYYLMARMNSLSHLEGGSVLLRANAYKLSFQAFSEKPIFGIGIGAYSVYASGVDKRLYPHNIILEIASELGIFALFSFSFLIFFCLLYISTLQKKYKEEKNHFLINTVLLLFLFIFLSSMVSGDISDNRLLFAMIGIIYSIGNILRKEEIQNYTIQQ
jgi:O-antigen ligase